LSIFGIKSKRLNKTSITRKVGNGERILYSSAKLNKLETKLLLNWTDPKQSLMEETPREEVMGVRKIKKGIHQNCRVRIQ